jgi:hypothetical protein
LSIASIALNDAAAWILDHHPTIALLGHFSVQHGSLGSCPLVACIINNNINNNNNNSSNNNNNPTSLYVRCSLFIVDDVEME